MTSFQVSDYTLPHTPLPPLLPSQSPTASLHPVVLMTFFKVSGYFLLPVVLMASSYILLHSKSPTVSFAVVLMTSPYILLHSKSPTVFIRSRSDGFFAFSPSLKVSDCFLHSRSDGFFTFSPSLKVSDCFLPSRSDGFSQPHSSPSFQGSNGLTAAFFHFYFPSNHSSSLPTVSTTSNLSYPIMSTPSNLSSPVQSTTSNIPYLQPFLSFLSAFQHFHDSLSFDSSTS